MIAENPLVAADRLKPRQPNEHRDADVSELERLQDEIRAVIERRIVMIQSNPSRCVVRKSVSESP